ncbi:MAG: YggT family protein [Thermotogota bacterium]|nr:YggT family protein [Thermotogota bacterium]MDK2864648.1 YggT family protein [Thermotogota bacterium]HCZ07364.1 YggT family protein [Thermotogota bacterium]
MFLLSNFVAAVAMILRILINIEIIAIIVSALLSWILPYRYHPVRAFFDGLAEFVVGPIRRFFPLRTGMFDFTPMLAVLLLIFVDRFVVESLFDLARLLR